MWKFLPTGHRCDRLCLWSFEIIKRKLFDFTENFLGKTFGVYSYVVVNFYLNLLGMFIGGFCV